MQKENICTFCIQKISLKFSPPIHAAIQVFYLPISLVHKKTLLSNGALWKREREMFSGAGTIIMFEFAGECSECSIPIFAQQLDRDV